MLLVWCVVDVLEVLSFGFELVMVYMRVLLLLRMDILIYCGFCGLEMVVVMVLLMRLLRMVVMFFVVCMFLISWVFFVICSLMLCLVVLMFLVLRNEWRKGLLSRVRLVMGKVMEFWVMSFLRKVCVLFMCFVLIRLVVICRWFVNLCCCIWSVDVMVCMVFSCFVRVIRLVWLCMISMLLSEWFFWWIGCVLRYSS